MTDREPAFLWRHAVICGLLWGVVVLMAVTLSQPVGDLRSPDLIRFVSGLTVIWTTTGLAWALGAKLTLEGDRPWLWLPVLMAVAWTLNLALTFSPIDGGGTTPGDFGHLTPARGRYDLAAYALWVNLFYGGLYALGYVATRRTMRLRGGLLASRLANAEAQARLRESGLRSLRAEMQPALLLETLSALRDAYADDRAAADEMFDRLINVLRAVMPSPRGETSSLAAERPRDLSAEVRFVLATSKIAPGLQTDAALNLEEELR